MSSSGSESERRVALQRTGHTVRAAASPAELGSLDRDYLDAGLAQGGVGPGVALVADDHAGLEGHHVVAVVPLLALGLEGVSACFDHAHVGHAEGLAYLLGQRPMLLFDHEVFGGLAGMDRPRACTADDLREHGDQIAVTHR